MRVINNLDEFRSLVGHEVAVSGWLTISQEIIDRFAALTLDDQWIHVDPQRAAHESPYGTTIAHGFLTLSLLSHLSRSAMEIRADFRMRINYGLNRVRFPAPAPAGSRVRARFTLISLDEIEKAVQLTWQATVELEGGTKPACIAEWLTRFYS
jgi:acyl dehydratase